MAEFLISFDIIIIINIIIIIIIIIITSYWWLRICRTVQTVCGFSMLFRMVN